MRKFKISDRSAFLGVALLAPAFLFFGLTAFSRQMDMEARDREQIMLTHGFELQIAHVEHVAVGQSVWDEALKHLQDNDKAWAEVNIRDFFIASSGFEYAAVVNASDDASYASFGGASSGEAIDTFAAAVRPLVADIRAREARLAPVADRVRAGETLKSPVQAQNLVKVGDGYYAVVATLSQPDLTPDLLKGRAPIVVIGEAIDEKFLRELGNAYLTSDLKLSTTTTRASSTDALITMADDAGRPVVTLTWKSRQPGSEMLKGAMPLLVLAILAFVGLAAFFHWRARRAIQQLVASEKHASHLAYHDTLTGLPNRSMLGERLPHFVDGVRRHGRSFAVHCIDLDRFKDVNDTFGHHVGDELIKEVGRLLAATCRQGDIVARLGGDEFAVIQAECTPAKAAGLAERLVSLLSQPVDLSVGRVYFGCSIGITMIDNANHDAAECLREADLALYRAKEAGRGRYCFFEAEMDAALRNRRALQEDLRQALTRPGELFMVYQPQVDSKDRVTGVEALMRWTHPVRGAVSPSVFIPLAEECGLIEQLGWFAMRSAFVEGARWPDLKVGVNVSASQLRLKHFLPEVKRLVEETGVDPTRYEFEITEGLLLDDSAETHAVLKAVREMGFQLALDDFGTGYSSLSYLQRFPITRIKIDRSFISNLGVEEQSEDVVAAIVRLARALRMAVVAEGVETDEQRTRLNSAGCRHIQGYLASKPLPVDQVQTFIGGETEDASRVA